VWRQALGSAHPGAKIDGKPAIYVDGKPAVEVDGGDAVYPMILLGTDGSLENCCTYVDTSMFAVASLNTYAICDVCWAGTV